MESLMSAQLKPSDKIKQVDPAWDAVRPFR